jgi:inorganic triphosphatase YgiF
MALETELKLALSPRFAARAARHPAIESVATEPAKVARLVSVYYDTPKFDLYAAGIALRLRRGATGWVQTVKWGGRVLGGLRQRGELETPVPAQQLNFAVLSSEELAAVFAPANVRNRLKPVFLTEFDRISRLLHIGDCVVEFSVDRGAVVSGTAREPICELELELLGGDVAVLFDLAARMQNELPLRPFNRSKAERGYALAGQHETPVKAAAIALTREMSVAESARRILASGLEQLQANENGMLSGQNPEFLHQMRVAVRRLRSALGAYSGVLPSDPFDLLKAELKWIGTRLGVARDWDVFLTELLPPLQRECDAGVGLRDLARSAREARARANRGARLAVRSRRYARLILNLGRIVATSAWQQRATDGAEPTLPFVTKLLERRYIKVVKRAGNLNRQGPGQLHALRIAIKKLRYALESFTTLFPGVRAKSFRSRLAELQESLGAINDAANMERLTRFTAQAQALPALVAGWNARIVHEERGRLRELWRGLRRARKFW